MTLFETFPDCEAVVAHAIRGAAIAGVGGVYSSVPRDPPDNYVVVTRLGGVPAERHHLDEARIQIDAWATSSTLAHDIAQAARVAVMELEGRTVSHPVAAFIAAVDDAGGLTFLPDPTSGKDRYLLSLLVALHGAPSCLTATPDPDPTAWILSPDGCSDLVSLVDFYKFDTGDGVDDGGPYQFVTGASDYPYAWASPGDHTVTLTRFAGAIDGPQSVVASIVVTSA